MPAQERSIEIDGRALAAINLSASTERQWQGIRRPKVSSRARIRVPRPSSRNWDEAGWDHDQDEAAGHRARRLLSRSNSGFHRFGDGVAAVRRWVGGERWVKRVGRRASRRLR